MTDTTTSLWKAHRRAIMQPWFQVDLVSATRSEWREQEPACVVLPAKRHDRCLIAEVGSTAGNKPQMKVWPKDKCRTKEKALRLAAGVFRIF
jgi:hypothetical protein